MLLSFSRCFIKSIPSPSAIKIFSHTVIFIAQAWLSQALIDNETHFGTLITGFQESQLLSISDVNATKRSSVLFVSPGKAIDHHALPPCISTHKPLVCLLLASYCWADHCLSMGTVVWFKPLQTDGIEPDRQTGLTRSYDITWQLQSNWENFLLDEIFVQRCFNLKEETYSC